MAKWGSGAAIRSRTLLRWPGEESKRNGVLSGVAMVNLSSLFQEAHGEQALARPVFCRTLRRAPFWRTFNSRWMVPSVALSGRILFVTMVRHYHGSGEGGFGRHLLWRRRGGPEGASPSRSCCRCRGPPSSCTVAPWLSGNIWKIALLFRVNDTLQAKEACWKKGCLR